ncbi:putative protein kinase [Gregarina niphandrodes]|uniref:Protein kinase domain-containing protein n=1 Tax=Gregarina niphandrodes TaxID=110365 RepID=A0A023BCD9_GRENI|nr:putative protein kinase [Gregarina niphandrodes]EZG83639.1 putative protein kinase [Gregarina niphandrodes]|eukprot:XP_011128919.1 putative protein kinase [Gregarina niphandrodes]
MPNVIKGKFEPYCCLEVLQACLVGSVRLGVGLFTGSVVAIKCVLSLGKESLEGSSLPETPLAEVFFSRTLSDCPSFVKVIEVVQQGDSHYIITEYANGEDLVELLKQYPGGVAEPVAALTIRYVTEAILCCHQKGIALQDFSLENCLLCVAGVSGDCEVKVCDPGQACVYRTRTSGTAGSASAWTSHFGMVGKQFRPPEIFEMRSYDPTKVDSWCLGWATWYFLYASAIFETATLDDERYQLFANGDIAGLLRNCCIENASDLAVDFVLKLMAIDPARRMSMQEALAHPFLARTAGASQLNVHMFPFPVEPKPPPSALKIALTGLSLIKEPLDRFKSFRYLAYSFPELSQALLCVDDALRTSQDTASCWRTDATTVSNLLPPGDSATKVKLGQAKPVGTNASLLSSAERRCRKTLEKIAQHAPYIPSYYTKTLMPLLCNSSKPSCTIRYLNDKPKSTMDSSLMSASLPGQRAISKGARTSPKNPGTPHLLDSHLD